MTRKKKRVLVVDDDDEILDSLRTALDARGYDVLLAHDGTEGLSRVERDAPDLVILDVVMPRRSGFTVLERLHQRRTGTPPVIMMTANEDPRHREFAESRGVNGYVHKPFDMDEVLELVDTLLKKPDRA